MSRRGSVLAEFACLLPIWLATGALIVGTLFALSLREWARVEAFSLARAHLYGNDLGSCELSSSSLKNLLRETRVSCSGHGQVEVAAEVFGPFSIQTRVDLTSGRSGS